MQRITDALELLTAQHEGISELLTEMAFASSPAHRTRLVTELTVHLAAEQELLYPAVSTSISHDVHAELLAEHVEIKRLLADLVWLGNDNVRFERKLVALRALFETHAMWQEHDLFPSVVEARTPDELRQLGTAIGGWVESIVVSEPTPVAAAAA